MSKVTIAGDANGTGVFTIAAPNGNTNRTLTLPDEAGTVLTNASDPSSIRINASWHVPAKAKSVAMLPAYKPIAAVRRAARLFSSLALTEKFVPENAAPEQPADPGEVVDDHYHR